MKKILPLFSYLLHPILIPVMGALLFFKYGSSYFDLRQQILILLQILILTIFIPLCFFLLLRASGKADSIMLAKTEQRKVPLLLQLCFTGILLWKSITADDLPELHYFLLSGITSTAVAFVFLYAGVKASLHLIGISSLAIFAIGMSMHEQFNMLYLIAGLIVLTGIVAASRLQMKAHDAKEIAIGLLAGVIPQLLFLKFWL